jgi:3-amino-5-hydroxybenzoic acid synthesis related protein
LVNATSASLNAAVLFDLDGTLADSEAVAAAAFRAAYAECLGAAADRAPAGQFLAMAGLPFERIVEELSLPAAMVESFRRHSIDRVHEVRLFPGVLDILALLRRSSVGMGIITGKDRPRAEQVIELIGLSAYCTELVTPSDPPAPKPAPDGVHWLLDRLSASTRHSVLVGDSVNDIRAGRAAGVFTVACGWGSAEAAVLAEAGPDALVMDPAALELLLRDHLGRLDGRPDGS